MNAESLRRARIWLGIVFLAGAGIGAVFGYSFGHRSFAATVSPTPNLSEPERRAKRVAEISKEVGLGPEQSAKVDDIIRISHEEMKAIRDKAEQDVNAVREKGRDEMRSVLSEEQKAKFEAMVKRLDEERKKAQQGHP